MIFKKKNEAEKQEERMSGSAIQTAGGGVSLLLGLLLTFVPSASIRTLCYIFCALLVAGGVSAIVYFFVTGAYRRLDDYNFAVGVMLLILGCCGFARIGDVEAQFLIWLGILTLVLGVVSLQNTVQLRVAQSSLWLMALVFTAVVLLGAITILLPLTGIWNLVQYWILILGGFLTLVCQAVTAWVLRKREEARAKAEADEIIPPPTPASAPGAAAHTVHAAPGARAAHASAHEAPAPPRGEASDAAALPAPGGKDR